MPELDGRVLHVHATDDGLDGAGEWLIRPAPDGITAETGHGKATSRFAARPQFCCCS
jgi:hypothetical protein